MKTASFNQASGGVVVSVGWSNGNGVIPLLWGGGGGGHKCPPYQVLYITCAVCINCTGGVQYMYIAVHVAGVHACGTVQALSISSHSHLPYHPHTLTHTLYLVTTAVFSAGSQSPLLSMCSK